eukprot:7364966-Prymnesium_polylepis.1
MRSPQRKHGRLGRRAVTVTKHRLLRELQSEVAATGRQGIRAGNTGPVGGGGQQNGASRWRSISLWAG